MSSETKEPVCVGGPASQIECGTCPERHRCKDPDPATKEFLERIGAGLEVIRQAQVRLFYSNPRYQDQVDRKGYASYTPLGIAEMDTAFCRRIQGLTSTAEADQIEREIRENLHLHQEIKDNLLYNLKNYRALVVD